MRLSVIVPVLNEAHGIVGLLTRLRAVARAGDEIIVVDGGSSDASAQLAAPLAHRVVQAPRGRALQMNAGAALATGDILLFLHADGEPPATFPRTISTAMTRAHAKWGRFDVRLSGRNASLRVVETLMNWRSRLTGIATGDQGMFCERQLFHEVGGFPLIPLMEDVALSKLLKRRGRPVCLHERVLVSSRRWERDGVWRTILLMWRLRLAFALGADPAKLARIYYPPRVCT